MSAITPPRAADYQIKEGTAVNERVIFYNSAGVAYTPSVTPTLFRTDQATGTSSPITFTYSGAAATGYTFTDIPDAPGFWIYEWKGTDATEPAITGDLVVQVRESWGF